MLQMHVDWPVNTMHTEHPKIIEILDFWLADADQSAAAAKAQGKRWFGGGETIDQEIRQRFGAWVEKAESGELDDWQLTARGALAFIILLDQFTRNVYRNSSRAFASDDRTLALSLAVQHDDRFEQLGCMARGFVLMPMQHSEDLTVQNDSVEAFRLQVQRAPEGYREILEGSLEYAILHRDIIERFRRFPHRNPILGRPHTDEEAAWLADGAPTFGQDGLFTFVNTGTFIQVLASKFQRSV